MNIKYTFIILHTICCYHYIFRTKIDWCFPHVIQMDSAVKEIAKIYIQGDKKRKLKSHKCPILGDRATSYTNSKVVDRLQHEEVKLSFLL